ncbi:MAG: hypothetical protein ACR2G0_06405 [Chthoniobacterales bacterium]
MNYSELVQLYFDRSTAMQNYWNLYVLVVGGLLAFSSLRKQSAAVTTGVVCFLFALFAHENLGAMKDVTAQRFALLESIRQFDGNDGATNPKPIRAQLEPTLTPATYASVRLTHVTSDVLTILALVAMEFRRCTLRTV